MTIPEAIEILNTLGKHGYWTMTPINSDAIKLGIEALKWWQAHRLASQDCFIDRLPGET